MNQAVNHAHLQAQPLSQLLAEDGLSPHNRKVFDYWQSLRQGDALPSRADFNPAHIRFALSRLVIVGTRRNEAGFFRLVGTAISCGLEFDPTGRPVSFMTPVPYMAARVERYNRILDGEALRNQRSCVTTARRVGYWQDLCLPFGDQREDGSRDVLITTDLMHEHFGEKCVNPAEAFGAPLESDFYRL